MAGFFITKMKNNEFENSRVKYQAALSLFASEGQIQWSRYNAMLVVNTILVGLITLNRDFNFPKFFQILFLLAPIFGFILCILWHRMTDRGFVWMNHWIYEANKLEDQFKEQRNPIQNGEELRSKIGANVTRNSSLLIIKIIALSYFLITVVNVCPLIITQK